MQPDCGGPILETDPAARSCHDDLRATLPTCPLTFLPFRSSGRRDGDGGWVFQFC